MQGKTSDTNNSLSKSPPQKASQNLALVKNTPESDPFRRLIFQFIDYCRADDISPRTIKDYQEKTFKFWWWWTDHTHLASTVGAHPKNVTTEHDRQFAAYLREPLAFRWGEKVRPGKEELSPVSVSSYGRTIKIFFSWLEDQQYIDRSPFSHRSVRFANRHKKGRVLKTVEPEEIGRLFTYLTKKDLVNTYEGCRNLAIFALLVDSGIRRGELLSIRLSDLELSRNRCQVRGKTGQRMAHFSDICKNALIKYLQNFRKDQTDRRDTPLWLCRDGLPLPMKGSLPL